MLITRFNYHKYCYVSYVNYFIVLSELINSCYTYTYLGIMHFLNIIYYMIDIRLYTFLLLLSISFYFHIGTASKYQFFVHIIKD